MKNLVLLLVTAAITGACNPISPTSIVGLRVLPSATVRNATQAQLGLTQAMIVAAFDFKNDADEDIRILDVSILDQVGDISLAPPVFNNLRLYEASAVLGSDAPSAASSDGYHFKFHLTTPLVIPRRSMLTFVLWSDVAPLQALPVAWRDVTVGARHTFALVAPMNAFGARTNMAASVDLSGATGQPITVIR